MSDTAASAVSTDPTDDERTAHVRTLEAHAALKRLAERAPATDEVRGLIATVFGALPQVDNPESIPLAPLIKTDAQLEQELARLGVEQARLDADEVRRQSIANAAEAASRAPLADTSDGIVATAPTPISGEQQPADGETIGTGATGGPPQADTSDGVNATAPGAVSGDTTQTDDAPAPTTDGDAPAGETPEQSVASEQPKAKKDAPKK